ncbi:hypothetical protein L6452_26970 [Arctium lappa]|uniref:Uncharacterized protein n=1 Tax=Arctium lappa TaxID=4217 RepID=A0ACB8ZV31_ARCLA|nr:hypothetical protein L6452_26970 [Arctium lappa]
MASISILNLLFLNLLFFATVVISIDPEDCVYTMYVRTGSMLGAGTDSKISLTVADDSGQALKINDLKAWGGLMGGFYNYFERDNLDIFSGKAPCLVGNVCKMNITSDNSGIILTSDWYCRYVEVTTTGAQTPCAQQTFTIEQWLSTTRDPKKLYATKDYCGLSSTGIQRLIVVDPENESDSAFS